tara:strand:+ start:91 stop:684 length:594 start_codon:yes stop_codon:yes gene_type:complete
MSDNTVWRSRYLEVNNPIPATPIDHLEDALFIHTEFNKSFNQAIDIGSCDNVYTEVLARCFSDVISIDARHDYALFDEETTKKFYVVDKYEGLSTFFVENFKHWEKKHNIKIKYKEIEVQTRTLDSFNYKPDFIKIDAEGSEPYILKGGMKTILEYKPTIMIEEMKDYDYSDILLPLGYEKIKPENKEDDPVYVHRN